MIGKRKSIRILVFGIIASCLVYAGILRADNSMNDNYILEKTEDFSIVYPLDWYKETKGEKLMIVGPVLTEEKDRLQRPIITIIKDTDEGAVRNAKGIKENYNRWKSLPNIKNKMLEFLLNNLIKEYRDGRHEFISSDYEENEDFIILHIIDIDKERNVKIYSVNFITKAEPLKSYTIMFICIKEYFDKYLPIFKRCVDSFDINK
ncbi:MAG: hypothetical protein Q8O13_08030 [Candidatus Omnitrophota bacterium]|nr:hypothetical protein [Candidatus Omnitrophota bacterium]